MTLLLGAFTFVALTIINSTLFYFMVWLPVRDLNFGIRSVLIGKQGELLEVKEPGDFGMLASSINQILEKLYARIKSVPDTRPDTRKSPPTGKEG